MGGADEVAAAVDELEQWRVVNIVRVGADPRTGRRARDARRAPAARSPARTPRAADRRHDRSRRRHPSARSRRLPIGQPRARVLPATSTARADARRAQRARFPDMIEALANHPGNRAAAGSVGRAWRAGDRLVGHPPSRRRSGRGRGSAGRVRRPCPGRADRASMPWATAATWR